MTKLCENDYCAVEKKGHDAPAQLKLREEIGKIKSQLLHLKSIDNSGYAAINCSGEIERNEKNLKLKESELKRKKNQAIYQRSHRLKTKKIIKRLSSARCAFTRFCHVTLYLP